MKLTVKLELVHKFLDLKYYKVSFNWGDKDTWIPDSIKLMKNGTIACLAPADILLKIAEVCNTSEVDELRLIIRKDDNLAHNLKVLTKQTEGKLNQTAQWLSSTPKEKTRLIQFFKGTLPIEIQ